MKTCRVKGNIVATIKNEKFDGCRFLIVQPLDETDNEIGESFVAVDDIGCGVGEKVLVTCGSSAKYVFEKDIPVDAAIIGIVDKNQ